VEFPYNAWVLQPSFKPKEVTLTEKNWYGGQYHLSDTGKVYLLSEIYPTKQAAIVAGREQLEKQREDLNKRQERIDKRAAALDRAEQQ
jgi:hypothetical protein